MTEEKKMLVVPLRAIASLSPAAAVNVNEPDPCITAPNFVLAEELSAMVVNPPSEPAVLACRFALLERVTARLPANVSVSVRPETNDRPTDPLPASFIALIKFAALESVTEIAEEIRSRIAADDVKPMLLVPARLVILERFAVLESVTELEPTIRSRTAALLEIEIEPAPAKVMASDKPPALEMVTDEEPAAVAAMTAFADEESVIDAVAFRLFPPDD